MCALILRELFLLKANVSAISKNYKYKYETREQIDMTCAIFKGIKHFWKKHFAYICSTYILYLQKYKNRWYDPTV